MKNIDGPLAIGNRGNGHYLVDLLPLKIEEKSHYLVDRLPLEAKMTTN